MEYIIETKNLCKSFKNFKVVKNINLRFCFKLVLIFLIIKEDKT